MRNIWILTEECPKISTVKTILSQFSKDFGKSEPNVTNPCIKPIYSAHATFSFEYELLGVTINNVSKIILCCASGYSSFCDYLLFYQEDKPNVTRNDVPLMIIEETKTTNKESRNSSIYQRGIKFVYARHYYPQTHQYMLYCNDYNPDHSNLTDTNIFGTNIYLNLGIKIIGKEPYMHNYHPFMNLDELIAFKNNMQPTKYGVTNRIDNTDPNQIKISVKIAKNGNISHDPGIGTVAVIAAGLRQLGYKNPIIVTHHGITQEMINRSHGNKLLYICLLLNVQLEGIVIPNLAFPTSYWKYENRSEKVTSIFLHIIAENNGLLPIFHNHAGCEKCYFISRNNEVMQLQKQTTMPDVVFYDATNKIVTVIESKTFTNMAQGISKVDSFSQIENAYLINKEIGYADCQLYRAVSIFGDHFIGLPDSRVLIYINCLGQIYVNPNAPLSWLKIFKTEGIL